MVLKLAKKSGKSHVAKFLDSAITITVGCYCLLKHLKTLLIKSSLGNVFHNEARWLTIWVNIFCISWILLAWFILKMEYSSVRVLILALFTSLVSSWVTCRVSHISWTILQFDTWKNSPCPKVEVLKLYWTFFLSSWVHSSLVFFNSSSINYMNIGTKGPFSMASQTSKSTASIKILIWVF